MTRRKIESAAPSIPADEYHPDHRVAAKAADENAKLAAAKLAKLAASRPAPLPYDDPLAMALVMPSLFGVDLFGSIVMVIAFLLMVLALRLSRTL